MYYAPTLAAHYATAFVPSLYSPIGPINKATSKSGFEIEDSLDYLPTKISQLNSALCRWSGPGPCSQVASRLRYLYMVGEQAGSIPAHLTIMMRSRRFTLYKIDK